MIGDGKQRLSSDAPFVYRPPLTGLLQVDLMDAARKRLLFRAHHMGTHENDLFFGAFADAHIAILNNEQIDHFEKLLKVPDGDLFAWVSGSVAVPREHDTPLMAMLRAFSQTTAP